MQTINRTLNQKASPKGVKCGSRVLYLFIMELYSQTSRNLLSTEETKPEEVEISQPFLFTNIESLKHQPIAEGDNTIGYVPVFEVFKMQPGDYVGIGWEVQKEAVNLAYNLPKSNVEGRAFEWSADGKEWTRIEGVSAQLTKDTLSTIDHKARYLRMRNTSNQPIETRILNFTVTTRPDADVREELMMFDMNLNTYKALKPGEMVQIKCDDTQQISLFLSGSNESLVSVIGRDAEGENQILYQGNVGYVKLSKNLFEGFSTLELSTIGKEPIHIHQIVRE